ncbi:hypothetical protein [Vagococcus carniphilus]|uniref:hypothetical protein n=1 Tax=Vagococcus carniphilus TaxID=218144 RepID=UPI003BABB142
MSDKKSGIIVVLLIIIAFGAGYFLGVSNKKEQQILEEVKTLNSSNKDEKDVKKTVSTTEEETIKDSSTEETKEFDNKQVAYDKMLSLKGTWAVWQTDNNFTIHEDGTWTTRPVGPGGDRNIPVEVHSYDEETNTIYLDTDGRTTELTIISDTEIIIDSGKGQSSTFVFIE